MKRIFTRIYSVLILNKSEESNALQHQRVQMFYAISVFISIVCLLMVAEDFILHRVSFISYSVLSISAVFTLNLIFFERNKNLIKASKIVFYSAPILLHIITNYSGGLMGPGFSAYAVYIIISGVLLGLRYCAASLAITLLEAIYFYTFGNNSHSLPHSSDLIDFFSAFCAIFTLVAIISFNSERTKNKAIKAAELAKQEVEKNSIELQNLSLIAKKSDNWVTITNKDGMIEWVNDAFTSISGYLPMEVIGKHIKEFIQEVAVDAKEPEMVQGKMNTLKPYTFKSQRYHKTGLTYWLRLNVTPIFNDANELTKYISVGNDITQLKESEESYKYLFDNNPMAILVTDLSGNSIYSANEAALNLLGQTKEELMKLTFINIFEIENRDEIKVKFSKKENFCNTYKIIGKDKKNHNVEVETQTIVYNGYPAYIVMCNDITEKVYAEETIKQGEARLKALLANVQDTFWAYNNEGRLITYNTQFSNSIKMMFGIDVQPGMTLLDKFPEPFKTSAETQFIKGLNRESFTYEITPEHQGKTIYFEISVNPIIDENNVVTGVSYFGRDTTESKRTQLNIAQSESKYRKLIETMNEGLLYVDNDNIIQFANDRFFEMTGYASDELIGKPTVDILLDDKNKSIVHRETEVRKNGVADQYEIQMTKKAGDKIFLLINAVPIYDDANENVIGSLATLTDITQKKINEHIARQTQEKYGTLIELMHEGLMYVDVNEVIQFANSRFCEISGYTQEDLVGKMDFNTMLTPEAKAIVESKNELRRNGISDQYEVPMLRKDGKQIWVLINGSPLYEEDGSLMGSLGTFSDISERKNTEEKLMATNRELDHFAYVVSHDLKAPLRAINNLSQWIEEDLGTDLSEDILKNMSLLRGRVHRIESLINGILDYSRAGREMEEATDVNSHTLVKDVVEMLAPPSKFIINIDKDLPIIVAEKTKLRKMAKFQFHS
ncbi:MAG: PAS domain S-box protein [Bacteroidetes bacterium]|nr:PAS domain S-box protein [Bacteroidota bacterium]